jgi:hypothetical protein
MKQLLLIILFTCLPLESFASTLNILLIYDSDVAHERAVKFKDFLLETPPFDSIQNKIAFPSICKWGYKLRNRHAVQTITCDYKIIDQI